MIGSAAVTVRAAAAAGRGAPRVGRRLPPLTAISVLVGGGWAVAAVFGGAITTAAIAGLGRVPAWASLADCTPTMRCVANLSSPGAGTLASLVSVVLLLRRGRAGGRGLRLPAAWAREAAAPSDLVVWGDPAPMADATLAAAGPVVLVLPAGVGNVLGHAKTMVAEFTPTQTGATRSATIPDGVRLLPDVGIAMLAGWPARARAAVAPLLRRRNL